MSVFYVDYMDIQQGYVTDFTNGQGDYIYMWVYLYDSVIFYIWFTIPTNY